MPRCTTGEQEAGDVGAANQQDDTDGGHEQEKNRADSGGPLLRERNEFRAEARVGGGIFLREPAVGGFNLRLRLPERHALLEPRVDKDGIIRAVQMYGVQCQRNI